MLLVVVRTLGLLALFFTDWWWVAAIGTAMLVLVGSADRMVGLIRFESPAPRVAVEVVCAGIGFFGVYHAPMLAPETAHLLAAVSGVVVVVELFYPFGNRPVSRY